MTTARREPRRKARDNPSPPEHTGAGDDQDGSNFEPSDNAPSATDRNLQARSNNRVYQAAGNQFIYDRPSAPPSAAPCNTLPRDTAAFTGRDHELRALVDAAVRCAETGLIIPVYAIDGMPGVGKSALAIHAGHLLEDQFPDGQFFLDLHAHTSGRRPVQPNDALFALLSASGVKPSQIPPGLDDRAALWRKRIAGNKVLLILDNAAGRWQVQPLLPGSSGCLVIITSRRRLTGLSAHQAAVTFALGTLPPQDATALFATMTNRHLNDSDAEAVHDLVRLSGYLPLAICLLAARLRPEPQWQIGDLVDDLSRTKHRLAHMHAEDVAVAAAFGLSYRLLPNHRRRFFRRLGLHPGPDLDNYAAAALDAITPAKAQQHLEALYQNHLLDQPTRGRYRMHDLISEYAGTLAEDDPAPDRELALCRLLDYYQHAARTAAARLSRPAKGQSPMSEGTSGRTSPALPTLRTRQQALAWMSTEQSCLFACAIAMPPPSGYRRLTALASAMAPYLRLAGPWDHAASLHHAAVAAAEHANDQPARAQALHELGIVHRLMGQYVPAESALSQALEICEQIDHRPGIANALTQLAGVRWRTGDDKGAADRLNRALTIYQSLGDLHGQADALDELGVVLYHIADYRGAVDTLRQALTIHEGLGDLHGEANALNQFGLAQQLTGEYPLAIDAHERALGIYRELGDRHGQARALNYLGIARCEVGDYVGARAALTQALTIHRDLGYRPGQANALNYLGIVQYQTRDYPAAEQSLSRALDMYRDLGHKPGQADTLNQLGVLWRLANDHGAAAQKHEQALVLFRQLSDCLGQAEVHNNLGELLLAMDQPAEALDHYQDALPLARQAHNPRGEAKALEGAGRCALRLSNPREAVDQLRRAQTIYERIGALHAAQAAAELAATIAA